jgi:heme A synthase
MSETHTVASGRRAAGQDRPTRLARLRRSSLGLVAMLILQFILGMIYNLYGTAPTSTKSIGLFSSPDLALHVVLGILLFIAAVGQLVQSIVVRHTLSIWLSALGLVSIIGAGFAGLGFTGSGANGASLGMSLAFATALACYVALVFALPSGGSPGAPSGEPSSSTT